jgi:oligopeptidase B
MKVIPEDKVLLFDCKMGSGHFGASGRYSYIKEIADDYAFVISRMKQYQLKKMNS